MKFYTEKHENVFIVKCDNGDYIHNIGMIEKPYHNERLYIAIGSNNETLSIDGSFIFRDFEAAKNKIIEHFTCEMEVLNK